MPIGRPTEVPAILNKSGKSPIPAPQTFNDPFRYCKTFGNVDQPGRRYIGPKLIEQIAATFDSTLADNPTIYWRCMDGSVWACQPGNGSLCAKVADNSAHIKTDSRGFSSQAWKAVSAEDKSTATAIVTTPPAVTSPPAKSDGGVGRFKWDFDDTPRTKHTYYMSQDKTTLKCYAVTKIGKNGQQIGKTTYPTKSAATAAMKVAPECNKM